MILPLLLVLQTPAAGNAAPRPIRIWMDASGPVSRGRGVRLYVEAQSAGNLVVLHSRSDGRIEVLFPARPTDNPHLDAGTYEVRGEGNGPVWTVNEPDGSGMILAALSPDPVWFNEFSRDVSWNPDALLPSWSGADPSGGMTDIVQRMLGDGGFTYDVLSYTVVPPTVAQAQPQTPDSTPPTYSDLQPDDAALTTCGVSSPVQCQLLGQPLLLGRGFRHHGFRQPPVAATPRSTPAVAAPLVYRIPKTPVSPATPVVPRRRTIPDVGVRSRARAASPAPVRTLESRPVAGAVAGHLAGAAPAARSALVLRYVHPPRMVASRPAAGAALAPVGVAPRSVSGGTVAAAFPVRPEAGAGVALMSRPMTAGMPQAGRSAVAPVTRTAPAPRTPAPATAAARTHAAQGAWMVTRVPMRGRGR